MFVLKRDLGLSLAGTAASPPPVPERVHAFLAAQLGDVEVPLGHGVVLPGNLLPELELGHAGVLVDSQDAVSAVACRTVPQVLRQPRVPLEVVRFGPLAPHFCVPVGATVGLQA